MSAPLLPPRRVFVITALLFDTGLEPRLKETLLQLMAMAWASPSHETIPLSFSQLTRLAGKRNATLYRRLKVLRTYRSTLRLRNAGDGQFVACLALWLYKQKGVSDSSSLESPVNVKENQEEEKESSHFLKIDSFFLDVNLNKSCGIPENGKKTGENSENGKIGEENPADFGDIGGAGDTGGGKTPQETTPHRPAKANGDLEPEVAQALEAAEVFKGPLPPTPS